MSERVVLVTGASSGSGRSAAETFASRGWRVFGTSRAPRAETNLANRVTMLALDVRDDEAPRACVEEVTRRAGRLDVLVNNAGIMLFGPAEEVPLDAAQALFETNFWGAVRMVNAVLPLLRQQRSGHIVNVGSVAGTTAIPLNAFYAATKHALAGYTEALRHEVRAFGVQVALVEPSDFASNLWRETPIAPSRFEAYGGMRNRVLATVRDALSHASGSQPVADAIVRIGETDAPRLHNPVGAWARALPRMKAWMPERMFERGVRKRFLGE
jgi:NAD(P)-dependent dehydrogenase (short-subunit alcohol dehydrogenase family)